MITLLLLISEDIFFLQTLARSTGISLSRPAEDPKVASWLLDPGAKEKNLHQLVGQHLPEEAPLLEGISSKVTVLFGIVAVARLSAEAEIRTTATHSKDHNARWNGGLTK